MKKHLQVDLDKCSGCRTCEMVCSLTHSGECNPLKSRIRVTRMKLKGVMIPVFCRQCVNPPCAENCPVGAIYRDENTGLVIIDYDACIGCKICVEYCPFGAITLDPETEQVIKCDLCGGDPQCVKYCIEEALIYPRSDNVEKLKRNKYTQKVALSYLSESEVT